MNSPVVRLRGLKRSFQQGDTIIEVLAHRIKNGLGYREVLAALFLAGIRNVSPQPPGAAGSGASPAPPL